MKKKKILIPVLIVLGVVVLLVVAFLLLKKVQSQKEQKELDNKVLELNSEALECRSDSHDYERAIACYEKIIRLCDDDEFAMRELEETKREQEMYSVFSELMIEILKLEERCEYYLEEIDKGNYQEGLDKDIIALRNYFNAFENLELREYGILDNMFTEIKNDSFYKDIKEECFSDEQRLREVYSCFGEEHDVLDNINKEVYKASILSLWLTLGGLRFQIPADITEEFEK